MKRFVSLICAIALSVSMLSAGCISVSAAENKKETVISRLQSAYLKTKAAAGKKSSDRQAPAEEAEEVRKVFTEVPRYYQTDYPDISYGAGTIATSGCSVTSLAMVASYLTGYTYMPDELANYFVGSDATSHIEKLEYMSDMLELPWERAGNFHKAMEALREGKIVIALMSASSIFTNGQHFIVLTGFNDQGRVMVNDPNEDNYSHWQLENAFREGFKEGDICCGFSGAWIYDPAAMTDSPVSKRELEKRTAAEKTTDFPQYFQNDYANIRYGSGSIATSGCSVTSLAMVATYLTGHTYMPDELADYFSAYNSINHIDKLEYMSSQLQLPWTEAENFHVALNAVKNGKIVIALMGETSAFTDGQHFIIWTGVNKNGKIMVVDANAGNYTHWDLKPGFQNGFAADALLKGYSGGWIYDPEQMPEEPFIYVEEKVEVECRYPGLKLTLEEEELLARMVWTEARGESFEGQQAIAEIVLNRLVSDRFQSSIRGIIYAENQFRSTQFLEDAEPTNIQYEAIERALEGPYVLPIDVHHFATYPVNKHVWGRIGGHVFCYSE